MRHSASMSLTHWGRVTHICVGNLTIIGPDNGLSPGRHQAIIWTSAGILLIGPWGTNFSEILIGIHTFSFKKMRLKVSSAKRQPFCLGLNVLNDWFQDVTVVTQRDRIMLFLTALVSQQHYPWQFLQEMIINTNALLYMELGSDRYYYVPNDPQVTPNYFITLSAELC